MRTKQANTNKNDISWIDGASTFNVWHADRNGNYSFKGNMIKQNVYPEPKTAYKQGDTIG